MTTGSPLVIGTVIAVGSIAQDNYGGTYTCNGGTNQQWTRGA